MIYIANNVGLIMLSTSGNSRIVQLTAPGNISQNRYCQFLFSTYGISISFTKKSLGDYESKVESKKSKVGEVLNFGL